MAMNYIEAPRGASKAQQEQYAPGIAQMASLARDLQSQGLLPERFAPEPSRLPSALEGKARIEQVIIGGGKSGKDLLSELRKRKVNIGTYTEDMAKSSEFKTLPEVEQRELVIASVGDLVPNPKGTYATTEEIWAARDQLGLQEVPAETALAYLLQNGDKLNNGDAIWMSMKTIAGRDGHPLVFGVARVAAGCGSIGLWTEPSHYWDPRYRFAFSLPQVNNA
jgi:hypothetical protein